MSTTIARCELCGEPMPPGEEVFKYHGYSGPCPKPPLPKESPPTGAQAIVFTLKEMRASGSWDVKTLNRAIELAEGFARDET